MKERFELQYGYVHCIGRTTYSAGLVDTEEEAREWATTNTGDIPLRVRVPDNDPIRTCPVAHCPLKAQRPWFSYRKIESEM